MSAITKAEVRDDRVRVESQDLTSNDSCKYKFIVPIDSNSYFISRLGLNLINSTLINATMTYTDDSLGMRTNLTLKES